MAMRIGRGLGFGRRCRRGAAIVPLTIGVIVAVTLMALVVELGRLYLIKGELQNAADAAALAGAIQLGCDPKKEMSASQRGLDAERAARHAARLNTVDGGRELADGDVEVDVGWVLCSQGKDAELLDDFDATTGAIDPDHPNGIRVVVHRTPGSGSGGVLLWFASLLDQDVADLSARSIARAVRADDVTGTGKKKPWDLSFVIDESGSMRSGHKLRWRKRWGRYRRYYDDYGRIRYETMPTRGYYDYYPQLYDRRKIDVVKDAMKDMSDYFRKNEKADRIGLSKFTSSGRGTSVMDQWGVYKSGDLDNFDPYDPNAQLDPVEQKVDQSHSRLMREVNRLRASGGTNIGRGLDKAINDHLNNGWKSGSEEPGYDRRRDGEYKWPNQWPSKHKVPDEQRRADMRKALEHDQHILLLTDGVTSNPSYAKKQADRAARLGIRIDTIAFGAGANKADLREIARKTGGTFFDCSEVTADKLKDIFAHIKELSQQEYDGFVLVH